MSTMKYMTAGDKYIGWEISDYCNRDIEKYSSGCVNMAAKILF